MSTIGNNIKFLRGSDTQEAFAKKFKTSRANINAYENDKAKTLPADLVERLCNHFGITHQQLTRQRLTDEDLKPTGRIESVLEVKLAAALRENEILKQSLADKEKIIKLYEGSNR